MVYARRAKDNMINHKRKKNQDRFDTIISYKKSKKRKIRREQQEYIPIIHVQDECR